MFDAHAFDWSRFTNDHTEVWRPTSRSSASAPLDDEGVSALFADVAWKQVADTVARADDEVIACIWMHDNRAREPSRADAGPCLASLHQVLVWYFVDRRGEGLPEALRPFVRDDRGTRRR